MKTLIIGMGEIGSGLHEVLKKHYEVLTYDAKDGPVKTWPDDIDILHICYPHCENFVAVTQDYIDTVDPIYAVIHSSCLVGQTRQLHGTHIFHSPVMAKHPDIAAQLLIYTKFLSSNNDLEHRTVGAYFAKAGVKTLAVENTETTELGKLLELVRYCTYLSLAKEQQRICQSFGLDYFEVVTPYERERNTGIVKSGHPELQQPVLYPFTDYIGGHCTIEDTALLLGQVKSKLIQEAYDIGRATKVWPNTNVYASAKIGKGVSIGQFSEIGNNVIIGNGTSIGAHTFIPEGVTIEDDCFIGPRVSFSNDKYPPSNKSKWGKILIKKGARLGMGVVVLPGVTVGEKALVGAGAIVTKSVPAGETWFGNPARKSKKSPAK
jgi:acetyltransferase-like isoleucine patch superfamily enzyme